jgi:hypothetical protein
VAETPIRGRWTDDEIAAMASRITRFGWPATNATAVVVQVIAEQERLAAMRRPRP